MSTSRGSGNNPFDLEQHTSENGLQWAGRSPSWARNMAHAYAEGNLKLIVQIRLIRIGGEVYKFVATLQGLMEPSDGRDYRCVNFLEDAYAPAEISVKRQVDQPVLVQILEDIENPKNGGECRVRSVVRLHAFDESLRLLREGRDSINLASECRGSIHNGELNLVGVRGRILPSIDDRQAVSEVIQGAPQIVSAIPGDQRQTIEWYSPFNLDRQAMAASYRIILFNDGVRVAFAPFGEYVFESCEVLFGTPDL